MKTALTTVTRRELLHSGLSVPVGLFLTKTSALATSDYALKVLEAFLSEVPVQYKPFELAARHFNIGREGKVTRITAVVALTWPPGNRSRTFTACAASENEALELICAEIVSFFVLDLA